MLLHAATPLLSVGDIMGSDSPEQPTKHIPLPVDGGERKFDRLLNCRIGGSNRWEFGLLEKSDVSTGKIRYGYSFSAVVPNK